MDYGLPFLLIARVAHSFQVSRLLVLVDIQDIVLTRVQNSWKVGSLASGLFVCFRWFLVLCLCIFTPFCLVQSAFMLSRFLHHLFLFMERVAKPFSFFWNNHQQDKPVSVYSPYFAFKKSLFQVSSFCVFLPVLFIVKVC